jgi:predicted DNA-binding protein
MAKKQAEPSKVTAIAEDKVMRHARIELPDEDYQRLKTGADRYRISVSAYIRMAVMERIERDEAKGGKA